MKECWINHSNSSGSLKFLFMIFILSLFAISPIFADTLTTCKTSRWVSGTTYYLTTNVSSTGTCMQIDANNVTLDCQGHSIIHTGQGSGIEVKRFNFTTIKNCNIIGDTSAYNFGIALDSSSNNIITNNIAKSNNISILLEFSSNNTIYNNKISLNSKEGISLYYSSDNIISQNTVTFNKMWGIFLAFSSNNIVSNNNASSNGFGISLAFGSNNTIFNNTAGSNQFGILLVSSSENIISNNNASTNNYGIVLGTNSNKNIISNNTINLNNTSIFLPLISNYNIISNNTVSNNTNSGIYLESSSNNTIYNNKVTSIGNGIELINNSNYNIISNNIFTSTQIYAASIVDSSDNMIYDNIFNGFLSPVYVDTNPNYWNTTKAEGTNIVGGAYICGNFYVNLTGGFSRTCSDTNSDGICDSPSSYTLATNNIDYQPLAVPVPALNSSILNQSNIIYTSAQNVSSDDTFGGHEWPWLLFIFVGGLILLILTKLNKPKKQ